MNRGRKIALFLHQNNAYTTLVAIVTDQEQGRPWSRLFSGILMMRDKLISFSVKLEFRKLFFVIRDLKVLRDQ